MDTNKIFLTGLTILGFFVIIDAVWIILMPPRGDEPQAYALVVIGVFMIFIGYFIAQRNRK